MKTRWIVVADASRARIIRTQGAAGALHDVEQLVHGESRLRGQGLASDRAGRSFDSHGQGRHAMEPGVEATEQEALRFAAEVSERLRHGRLEKEFDELVLVAPPRFLGMLRQSLEPACARCVRAELDRELTTASDEDIRKRISKLL